jgi:hypothetical protein
VPARGLGLSVLLLALACASRPEPEVRYRPAENLLEVVAVLRRHVPDDTYRFAPATDFSGRNVYRASLLRLENIERVHAEALRAGHMDDVIAFSKGRALERLRAFSLAAQSYRRAAEREGPLRQDALRGASVCDALDAAARIGFDASRPPEEGETGAAPRTAEEALAVFERRVALLEAIGADVAGTHYAAIVREEIERADLSRADFFAASRRLGPDGDVLALSERQRVITRHRESKLVNRHLLSLADLYADMADEYVAAHPPESLLFDPPAFEELADSASRLYEAVANQDGTTEKLEAQRRLEAFLAFTLRVDRDRFSR